MKMSRILFFFLLCPKIFNLSVFALNLKRVKSSNVIMPDQLETFHSSLPILRFVFHVLTVLLYTAVSKSNAQNKLVLNQFELISWTLKYSFELFKTLMKSNHTSVNLVLYQWISLKCSKFHSDFSMEKPTSSDCLLYKTENEFLF